jgi:uncharacterized membrane protein YhhN
MQFWFITICLLACVCVLISERVNSRLGKWLSKPVAATAFIALALSNGALDSNYGMWILTGLGFSWFGDLLLIQKESKRFFLIGIGSFLLAHLAYSVAFLGQGFNLPVFLLASVMAVLFSWWLYRWLSAALQGLFVILVPAYIGVIMLMLVLACSALATGMQWLPVVGALLFALSDISVARDRFICQSFSNRLWGLPMYFIAQLLLAASV